MAWQDRLRPASFRGIRFAVDTTDLTFGRRNQLHEYPKRDIPYSEDLGKKGRQFSITAFIIGDNYIAQRNLLIDAIEKNKTPGTLICPTLGSLQVIPGDCTVSFNNQEGGIERFLLTFYESGRNAFPTDFLDSARDAIENANNFIDAVEDFFENGYSTNEWLDFIANAAQGILGDFVGAAFAAAGEGIQNPSNYADFSDALDDFSASIPNIFDDPTSVITGISGIVGSLSGVYDALADAFIAQQNLLTFGNNFVPVDPSTPTRTQQALNQKLLTWGVQYNAIAQMAKIIADLEFTSREEALYYRDQFDEAADAAIIATADDNDNSVYLALIDLRAAVVNDINRRSALLPDVETIKINDSIPALVFAYNVYDDASRFEEIVTRNHVENPNFLPSQTNIEYLER